MIGDTVSRYRILELLGSGGRGVVYKAEDLRLGRLVALKFLSNLGGENEEEVCRFRREARAAAAIEHPNLCTVYEIGDTETGQLFLAMAFYEGETLEGWIERGPLDLASAVGLTIQVASGLAEAHRHGIVHRDVKPDNVLVTADGQAKILDFGIAHLVDQTRLTRAGSLVGTASHMSPEQLRGEPGDPRMDIWSLGVVLYEMVTGRLPFRGEEAVTMYSILHLEPAPMATLRPEVPPELDRIVSRALTKKAADRYGSLEEMLADLSALAGGSAPVQAAPPPREAGARPKPAGSAGPLTPPEMPGVWIGRTVGPYRILRVLGGGGMGLVYEAEDTRLHRKVALKFLPPRLTLDPESKERFLEEARAASAMDHPNLCTIYEVEETDDGQLYLAMPRYDGETLRKRLERGPMPLAEAMDVARQVARGLSRVHRQGIVHRDVKPANLILTADGLVKILDFGIAKLAREAVAAEGGASAGTPAYRSPEQTSGEPVDARTDLWSLGVVLYEMLAGRRPFRGDQEQAVAYAVLYEEPEPLSRLRPEVGPDLERIVSRLLAKAPAGRYPDAEEAAADLRALSDDATGTLQAPVKPQRWSRSRRWSAAVLVLAAAALAAVAGRVLVLESRSEGEGAPSLGFTQKLTSEGGLETSPSLSPDGKFVVYAKISGRGADLFRQAIPEGTPVNLTSDFAGPDLQPAFSPDGEEIAFRSEREGGGLFVLNLESGRVRPISPEGYNPAWSPTGREVVYATENITDPGYRSSTSELWRVEVATGRRWCVHEGDAVQPTWSPHGLRIAFWSVEDAQRILATIPAEGGEAVRILEDDHLNWNPVWSRDGKHLYFASNRGGSMNLWRIDIDEASGKVQGEAEPLRTPAQSSSLLSLSEDDRRIAYAVSESRYYLEAVAFDLSTARAAGPRLTLREGSQAIRSAQLSPDGEQIVFDTSDPREDLFIARPDGSEATRLTDDLAKDRGPQWSPDGSRILFYSNRKGQQYQAWTVRPDASGLEPVTAFEEELSFPVWSPDGKQLAGTCGEATPCRVDLTVPLARRRPQPLRVASPAGGSFAPTSWSPDGEWLAGSDSQGAVLYSLRSGRLTSLTGRCVDPVWLPDNRTLLCLKDGKVLAIDARTREVHDVLAPPLDSRFQRVSASPDGKTLYIVRVATEGDIALAELQ